MTPHRCDEPFTRRTFLKTGLGGLAAATTAGLLSPRGLVAAPTPTSPSETLAATLYKSLAEEQRAAVCYPFDHPLRQKVDNNWHINQKRIGQFFQPEQRAMIREIFTGLHSPEYATAVMQQVEHDNEGDGGFDGSAVALFGEPGGPFEFVLTGRHVTRRCDGDTVAGAAFGGPIFYGHAPKTFTETADHPGNIYWYQAKRANEAFAMLDGKQREQALLGTGREEDSTETVRLGGKSAELPGLPVAALSADQRAEVRKVLADVLAPFRKEDVEKTMQLIEPQFEQLHLSYYKNQDIGNDGVWDVWQIEGPSMVWYFRGQPHVHVWVNVRAS